MTETLIMFSAIGVPGCTKKTGLDAPTGAAADDVIANEFSDDNDVATALGVAIGGAKGVNAGRSYY